MNRPSIIGWGFPESSYHLPTPIYLPTIELHLLARPVWKVQRNPIIVSPYVRSAENSIPTRQNYNTHRSGPFLVRLRGYLFHYARLAGIEQSARNGCNVSACREGTSKMCDTPQQIGHSTGTGSGVWFTHNSGHSAPVRLARHAPFAHMGTIFI